MILHTSIVDFPDGTRKTQSEDFFFEKDESYLIYAFRDKNEWRTNACTRTKKLSEAEADLHELGEGFFARKVFRADRE